MTVWLLVPEVAERLRLSDEQVRRLIRRGDLAASNVGTSSRPAYRVSTAAADRYMDERRTSASR
ncbi:helix-turn-helix domain-containing protein [Kribbella sp. NPDC051587]|uniref:helix-turn-helix domain-containing protein n=1 Tax=Kribbella sp. NPDC051587 TaxID=3364119 RepID=UPI0037AAE762